MAGDLSRRIAVTGTGDEFDVLADEPQRHARPHRGADERPERGLRQHRPRSEDAADAPAQLGRGGAARDRQRGDAYREGARADDREGRRADQDLQRAAADRPAAKPAPWRRTPSVRSRPSSSRDVAELYEPVAEERGHDARRRRRRRPAAHGNRAARRPGASPTSSTTPSSIRPSRRKGPRCASRSSCCDRGDGSRDRGRRHGPGIAPERSRARAEALRAPGEEPHRARHRPRPQPCAGGRRGCTAARVRLEDNRPGLRVVPDASASGRPTATTRALDARPRRGDAATGGMHHADRALGRAHDRGACGARRRATSAALPRCESARSRCRAGAAGAALDEPRVGAARRHLQRLALSRRPHRARSCAPAAHSDDGARGAAGGAAGRARSRLHAAPRRAPMPCARCASSRPRWRC